LKNTKCKCFKCNMRQTGFYRVLYPLEFYEQFAEEIKQNKVEELDRFGLQNDAFALAKANLLPFNTVLELIRAYENEKSYHIWQDLTAELLALSTVRNFYMTRVILLHESHTFSLALERAANTQLVQKICVRLVTAFNHEVRPDSKIHGFRSRQTSPKPALSSSCKYRLSFHIR
jgi:aminopeptidase N